MEIKMPRLGLTMTEGTITRWLVGAGQGVKAGDILFEFENDKSSMEYEAPEAGVMGVLLVGEGVTVACGTPVAVLALAREGSALAQAGVEATPAAKRRARELGVALAGVQGRGVNGRIHLIDVEEMVQQAVAPAAQPAIDVSPVAKRMADDLGVALAQVAGSGPGGRIMRGDVVTAVRGRGSGGVGQGSGGAGEQGGEGEVFGARVPLGGVRRVIAERMSGSAFTAPHVTLHTEVDATQLVAARQQLNEALAGQGKISFNALLIALTAKALGEFPQMNACLLDDEICQYAAVNIGLAVDTERGLLVPVIRAADTLGVLAIQRAGDELIRRATVGKSLPDDLVGGTFTITNLGMFGIDAFTPIINQPQAAILGVGRIVNKPVGHLGELVLRDRLTLSLSFDHRLVDGGPAARFLQRVGQLVERPLTLLL